MEQNLRQKDIDDIKSFIRNNFKRFHSVVDFLNQYDEAVLDEEVFQALLVVFPKWSESVKFCTNDKLMRMAVRYRGRNLNYVQYEIDDELFEFALKNGYRMDEDTTKAISCNKEYVKKCIKRWGGSQINYATCEIDEEMIDFLIELGYSLSSFSLEVIKGNEAYVKKFIEAYGGNQLDYATCPIEEELVNFAMEYDLIIDATNIEHYANVPFDEALESIWEESTDSYKKNIHLIQEQTSSFLVYYLKDNLILNEKIIDGFGIDLVMKCIKYLYLTGKEMDLEVLLEDNHMTYFKFILNHVLGKNLDNISIDEFYDIVGNFSSYSELIVDIMNQNVLLREEEKEKIITLFQNKDERILVGSLDDLDNISKLVIDENKKVLKSDNIWFVREAIYLTNFNLTCEDVSKLREEYQINVKKIKDLLQAIEDTKIKSILMNYCVLFEIIEFIEKCSNIEVLKGILSETNNKLSQDKNYFKESHYLFDNIVNHIKYFYGMEILEKTSNHDRDVHQEEEMKLSKEGKEVKYSNVFHNQYYFQHTLNAYSEGSKLSDFKNSRLVGKTYICLSLIDNNHKGVIRVASDMDHVTLLFDRLDPSSLCVFSECDLNSDASNNSREVMYEYSNFDTVKNILEKTGRYNEYVYYRENNDGSSIYPSGVLVTGDEPSQAEIDAAAYLNVPLIKLNPTKEKEKQEEPKKGTVVKKSEVIKELKEMKE